MITAIHELLDTGLYASYFVLPAGVDIEVLHRIWSGECTTASFVAWLRSRGMREPTAEELVVFEI
jgi:hypothetical protein